MPPFGISREHESFNSIVIGDLEDLISELISPLDEDESLI